MYDFQFSNLIRYRAKKGRQTHLKQKYKRFKKTQKCNKLLINNYVICFENYRKYLVVFMLKMYSYKFGFVLIQSLITL